MKSRDDDHGKEQQEHPISLTFFSIPIDPRTIMHSPCCSILTYTYTPEHVARIMMVNLLLHPLKEPGRPGLAGFYIRFFLLYICSKYYTDSFTIALHDDDDDGRSSETIAHFWSLLVSISNILSLSLP